MDRLDIINYLIQKGGYKTYGEIGIFTGYTLDGCIAESKIGIDPNIGHYKGRNNVFHGTSDQYFTSIGASEKKDIWFIDGLHEAKQVERDIQNSLKHLSPGGTIVLHDCNPPKYEHTTTGIDGCWTGDVYKTAIKYTSDPLYNFYTVDTDWGVGVLTPVIGMHANGRTSVQKYIDNWNLFDENRQWLLNLISIEEFKTKMNEGQ